jgi:drug/metabolite transporter (DMT)-like permease
VWGFYSVSGKLAMKHVSPLLSTVWAGIFGVGVLLPFSGTSMQKLQPAPSLWLAVVYLAVGGTTLAMVFWNVGVQKLGGTRAGMFLNLNPIFTALFAYAFLGDHMSAGQWVGTAVVIAGVYLFTRKPAAAVRQGV